MIMSYLIHLQQWFIRYIHLQLFILFIVLPFLIGWGLPISILSLISTLLFSPFLLLFLFFSSVVFFLELFCLPNKWLISFVEYLGDIWFYILDWEQSSWLKGFIKPESIFLLLFIPLSALFLIHFKYTHRPVINMLSLCSLFLIVYIGLSYFHAPIKNIHVIPCHKKETMLIYHKNNMIFIDPGSLATNSSVLSWLSYTFIPYLIKSTGRLSIDHAVILQPSTRTFEAFNLLCTKVKVKKLYVPWWQNRLPKKAWFCFMELQETAKKTGCQIARINKKPVTIAITETDFIHLKPQDNYLAYTTITYPSIHVEGMVNRTLFNLYPNLEKRF